MEYARALQDTTPLLILIQTQDLRLYDNVKPSISSVNSTGLSMASAPVEKFLKMMSNSRFQQTGIRDSTADPIVNSMGSIENALNYLLDNFVIVRKREFHGISGYFCKNCLSFQYRYVRNIWDEKTAKDEHVHNPNMLYDANRPAKELEKPHAG